MSRMTTTPHVVPTIMIRLFGVAGPAADSGDVLAEVEVLAGPLLPVVTVIVREAVDLSLLIVDSNGSSVVQISDKIIKKLDAYSYNTKTPKNICFSGTFFKK